MFQGHWRLSSEVDVVFKAYIESLAWDWKTQGALTIFSPRLISCSSSLINGLMISSPKGSRCLYEETVWLDGSVAIAQVLSVKPRKRPALFLQNVSPNLSRDRQQNIHQLSLCVQQTKLPNSFCCKIPISMTVMRGRGKFQERGTYWNRISPFDRMEDRPISREYLLVVTVVVSGMPEGEIC